MATAGAGVNLCLSFLLLLCALSHVLGACNESSWFGPACQYMCHCVGGDEACNKSRGNCLTDECQEGYAGTTCQYVNLAYNQDVQANISITGGNRYLYNAVDGKLTTCIVGETDSDKPLSVKVAERSFVDVISVLLFKTFVLNGNGANVEKLEVTFYDSNNKPHVLEPKAVYLPTDILIHYHLPKPTLVTRIQVRALHNSQLAICEISALGGRNLALKRSMRQTNANGSVSGNGIDAPKVVDGKYNTCSHGDNGQDSKDSTGNQSLMWTMSLGSNTNVWRVKVFTNETRDDGQMTNEKMKLTLRNSQGEEVFSSEKTGQLEQAVQASELTVWLGSMGDKSPALCEVELLGDCQDGYYGWDCNKRCRCKNPSEICDKIWGYCPISSCELGYWGDDCSKQCMLGTYGLTCAQNCSAACVNNTCHHVTGQCTNGCRSGYNGMECTQDCPLGSYGERCSLNCSDGCQGKECDLMTGICMQGCLPGWKGDLCNTACDPGYYGNQCSQPCSKHCINNSCDTGSGDCLVGCVQGMMGPKCSVEVDSSTTRTEGMVTLLIAASVIVGVFQLC